MSLQKGKATPGNHTNHQPRVNFTNSRIQSAIPAAHLNQVTRIEDYSRQGSGFQQPGQNFHQHYTALASVTGPPHDMSKQAALQAQAQNPGLYTSPTPPGVAGPGNPPQPSAMPAQVPPSQLPGTPGPRPPNQVVHNQGPRNQMQVYSQQPRNALRNIHPGNHWQTGPMNAPQQQPNQYNLQTHWIQHQNSHFSVLLRNTAPVANMVPSYANQVNPQFQPTPQPSAMYAQQPPIIYTAAAGNPGTYGYPSHHQRPAAGPYYHQQMYNRMYTQQGQTQNIHQTPPVQAPPQKKKIITIQDPDTMQDVTKDVLYGDQNNSNQLEPTQHQLSDVAIEFAAKVASVVSSAPTASRQDMDPLNSPNQTQIIPGQILHQQGMPAVISNEPLMEGMDVYTRRAVLPVYELGEPLDIAMEVDESQMAAELNPMCEVSYVVPALGPSGLGPPSIDPLVPIIPPLMADLPPTNIPSEEEYPLDEVEEVIPPVTNSDSELPIEYSQEIRTSESESYASIEIVPLRQQTVEVVTLPVELTQEDSEVELKPQQNGDVRELMSPAADNKESADGRDSKKVSKARKMKELNKRGESKEGSEMDAFVDKEMENSVPVPPAFVKVSSPPPVVISNSLDVDQEEEDKEEEERKVAEKNEENKRYSQEVEIEPTPVIEPPKPQLPKYQYKEADQWSPLNPEGKKHYDRAFLIMLQSQPMSLQKPKGLPDLDVIKDRATQHNFDHSRPNVQITPQVIHRNQHDLFIPHYARGGTPRNPQGGVNRRQSQQGGRDKPKKIISSSFSDDVKLHAASNAWKPTRKETKAEKDEEDAKTQDLYKRFRGILNKLTPQKFQTLVEQVKDLPIDTEVRLTGVIDLVFEKAVDEPNFSVPYANMCKDLMKKQVPSEDGTNVNFRKLLLTKCQKEFEKDKNDTYKVEKQKEIENADTEEKKAKLREELEEEERKARRRSLGNIRFIGELFKLGMLTAHIMHDCLGKLLGEHHEESLECLCRLLTTIGKELEPKNEKNDKHQFGKMMDGYFNNMRKIVMNKQTSSRVRFMLQDVIDLRMRYWVPRREDNNPKTIDQIHLEAERDAAQTQALLAQQPSMPSNMNKRIDDRDRRKNRGGHSDEGWNTVGSNKGRGSSSFNSSYDANKNPPKLISRPVETDSIQLGPGSRGGWSKGSSGGGAKANTQDIDSKPPPSNRFFALADQNIDTKRMQSPEMSSIPAYKSSTSARREPSAGRASSQGPPGPSQVRKTNSQMANRDREKAIAAVKAIADQQADPIKPISAAVAEPSPKDLESKEAHAAASSDYNEQELIDEVTIQSKPIVDQFLYSPDFDEAVRCIREVVRQSTLHLFLSTSINYVLERSSQARTQMGQLFRKLVDENILTLHQYSEGLLSIVAIAEDLAIDIPNFWTYLAEIIAPMVQDGVISMSFLERILNPNINTDINPTLAGKAIAALLHVLANKLGPKNVHELFHSANLKLSSFLSADQVEQDFVIANKLEFIEKKVQCVVVSSTLMMSAEEVERQLGVLFRNHMSNEQIFQWIETNVGDDQIRTPPYVRALVSAVTESAIKEGESLEVDNKAIKDRLIILAKYLENQEPMELQALYAIQALIHRLQHPQGMLTTIFNILYDEDVISEDAFTQWEKSSDPAEKEGKGVALKSVASFFTWLKEAEGDSSNE